jgi:DinB superfamily
VPDREVLSLEPDADDPEVGRWLSALQDCRRDTIKELNGVTDAMIDVHSTGTDNSVATILYHVALIEADWLLADIFGFASATSAEPALFPIADRGPDHHLTVVAGETLGQHIERLAAVRSILLDRLRPMTSQEFHRARRRDHYDVTPAWVVHHPLQHEAEHRSELGRVKAAIAR